MKKLKPLHNTVARYMALNPTVPLADICKSLDLNYGTWKSIVNQDLFLAEVRRITNELENREIEEASKDPVRRKLKMAAVKAAERLIEEVDNFETEQGASSSTRIKAADSLLAKCGYNNLGESQDHSKVVINISEAKVEALTEVETELAEQPQSITG